MKKLMRVINPLLWVMAFLLAAFVAGCGGDDVKPVGITTTSSSSATKAISAFSIGGIAGAINEAAVPKSITLTLPFGASLAAQTATFTSDGAGVTVGGVAQMSGATSNSFSAPPVLYTVTAANGTTAVYHVTVTLASSSAKAITAYAIGAVAGVINEAAVPKTITLTLPFGASLAAQTATFTSDGAGVTVGGVAQMSGTTSNSFSAPPVLYTVTAADGTTAVYHVTVTVALSSARVITAYSINGVAGVISEATVPKTIAVSMPFGTSLAALTAIYTSTGASVTVGGVTQTSGTVSNSFSAPPVFYTVHAADGSTAIYNVTVTAAGVAAVPLATAGNYTILAKAKITTTGVTAITGDIAISPAAATLIQGFSLVLDGTGCFSTPTPATLVSGRVYAADYNTGACTTPAILTTAINDMAGNAAAGYLDAAGRPAGTGAFLNAGSAGNIGGLVLPPGVYTFTGGSINVTIPTHLTLSGAASDVWIFQIPGTLAISPATHILLSTGVQAKNIFWQVAGAVTLDTTSHFEGVILTASNLSMLTGATANSRLLSQTQVALDANTVMPPAP